MCSNGVSGPRRRNSRNGPLRRGPPRPESGTNRGGRQPPLRIRRRGQDDVLELVDLVPEVAFPGSVPGGGGEHHTVERQTGDVRDFCRRELPDALVLARVLTDATLADGVA